MPVLKYKKDVWAFAQRQANGFLPTDVVQYLRGKTGEEFPASGGNTVKVYAAIYALVREGKLKKVVVERKTNRHFYKYEVVR